jgi:hypothetical protein
LLPGVAQRLKACHVLLVVLLDGGHCGLVKQAWFQCPLKQLPSFVDVTEGLGICGRRGTE